MPGDLSIRIRISRHAFNPINLQVVSFDNFGRFQVAYVFLLPDKL
jgi:hypothetical protein